MGNPLDLFKPPKIKIPDPPPVPTIDEARQQQEMNDRMRRRRGRAANQLTGPQGDRSTPSVSAKKLLGT